MKECTCYVTVLTINQPGSEAVQWLTESLVQAGFKVSQSFDLRSVRDAFAACACGYQANNCDCDMAILLVYGTEPKPATIMTQSRNGRTRLTLIDAYGQRAPASLEKVILQTVLSEEQNKQ